MKELPLVTILIPTYNQALFLDEAICSALAQTYPHLEVIVGDDASTDATPNIVAEKKDSRLKYVRNPSNLGRVANYRHLLYHHASGDYVVNLDGDDYYTDTSFITEAVKLITGQQQEVVMVMAKATTKTSTSEFVSDLYLHARSTGMDIVKKLPNRRYLLMHMAVLYARQAALDIGFYRSPTISSDWESLYRLMLKGQVAYLNRNVGVWRIHGSNATGTTSHGALIKNLAVWPAIFGDAVAFGLNPLHAGYLSARCIAFFAQSSCIKLSLQGNATLISFLIAVIRTYKGASMLMLLTPQYSIRLLLSFFGYYRFRQKKPLF
jgi:glycosyltransferase involved in cell wall biosynthesis